MLRREDPKDARAIENVLRLRTQDFLINRFL